MFNIKLRSPRIASHSSKNGEDFHQCGDSDDVKEDVKFSDSFAVDSEYKDAFIKFCRDLEKCNEMIFLNTSGGYKKDLQITTVGGVFRDLNGNVIGLPFHGRVEASGSFEAELLATQFGLEVASHVPITLPILVNMAGHEAVKMINTSHHTEEKFFEAYAKKSDRAHKSNLIIGSFRTILNIKNIRFVPEKRNRFAHQLSTLAAGRSNKKIHFLKEPFSHRISEAYKLDKERKSFL